MRPELLQFVYFIFIVGIFILGFKLGITKESKRSELLKDEIKDEILVLKLKIRRANAIQLILPFLKKHFSQYGSNVKQILINLVEKYFERPMGGHAYYRREFGKDQYLIEFPDWVKPRGIKLPVKTVNKMGISQTYFNEIEPFRLAFVVLFEILGGMRVRKIGARQN